MVSFIAAINKKQTKFLLSAITTYINTNLFTSSFLFFLDMVNPVMLLLHANIDQNKYGCGRHPVWMVANLLANASEVLTTVSSIFFSFIANQWKTMFVDMLSRVSTYWWTIYNKTRNIFWKSIVRCEIENMEIFISRWLEILIIIITFLGEIWDSYGS